MQIYGIQMFRDLKDAAWTPACMRKVRKRVFYSCENSSFPSQMGIKNST